MIDMKAIELDSQPPVTVVEPPPRYNQMPMAPPPLAAPKNSTPPDTPGTSPYNTQSPLYLERAATDGRPSPASLLSYPSQGAAPEQQPQMTIAQQEALIGQQYQQQLFAHCARGDHALTTSYGMCGIISAVLLFPAGLLCLLVDNEKRCARCGVRLD